MSSIALLSIGSNVGDKPNNISKALQFLAIECKFKKENISSLYETEPFGNTNQPWFLNIAVIAYTDLSPSNLLFFCKSIEYSLGRQKSPKWTERVIDIDILLYNDFIIDTPSLILPHKFICERKFILLPANEIAPKFTKSC